MSPVCFARVSVQFAFEREQNFVIMRVTNGKILSVMYGSADGELTTKLFKFTGCSWHTSVMLN